MKHILTLGLFLFLTIKAFAQTDGISYQAVIIAPDVLELPGVDSEGNYLPNANVAVKFIIFDSGNQVEFEEIQTTTTDEFGRINLIIGAEKHDDFEKISWDGTAKDLKVEIDFGNGDGFIDMNREILTFVPYAYHRNITATGTLDVDGDTFLNRELTVNGPTTLNSTLLVDGGNETNLSGDLNVDGETNLNNTVNVTGQSPTNLSGALTVGVYNGVPDVNAPTVLNGSLEVKGKSTFGALESRTLKVTDSTELNGVLQVNSDTQVKITSALTGSDLLIGSYPLLVEGGNQGIAIKVNTEDASNSNNFVSFWDETPVGTYGPYNPTVLNSAIRDLFDFIGINDAGIFDGFNQNAGPNANTPSGVTLPDTSGTMLWGRIEGETNSNEFSNNADYNLEQLSVYYDLIDGGLDLVWELTDLSKTTINITASLTSSTVCVGIGTCVTAPIPSFVASASASAALQAIKVFSAVLNEVFAAYMLNTFYDNKNRFRGVSYASGAGDYAEYLLRLDLNEKMSYGDIVGVKGGKISKNTSGAERMMVISYKPAVLGALPQESQEQFFEKVAFMGQVPVKVIGKVRIGDYIIPSGGNNGVGIAISPENITSKDVKNIVGVAWEASDNEYGYNLINTAVGINNNDNSPIVEKLEKQVLDQQKRLDELASLLTKTIERLEAIESGETLAKYDDHSNQYFEDSKDNVDYYGRKYEIKDQFVYYELTDNDIDEALKIAEKTLIEVGGSKIENFVLKKIKEDPEFKQKFASELRSAFKQQVHFHKEINEKSGH
ncbi:hypothetical protein L3X39_06305 [Sabulilitoribacter multivorans]|uniref:Uncharacterized protein n=1 Tax=Flaviramulus multivorans TaxID=1304750 RepID=A0ABS9IHK8_9FLAO|nr:hypothetical protein [Flaviramulus multivorans]MCF7560246.1 hypothetical protein [Flaviramulus multivorans]